MNSRPRLILLTVVAVVLMPGVSLSKESAWESVTENKPDEALRIIAEGGDIKVQSHNGDRLTHIAASHGQTVVLAALLDKKLKVDQKNGFKSTPLIIAAGYDHLDSALLLIERGARVDHQNENGFSPVYLAAVNSNLTLLNILAERGADVDAALRNGSAPLHAALMAGDYEIAMALMELGASVSSATDAGDAPLHFAVAGGNIELVRLLLDKGVSVNVENQRGDTPLTVATALGRSEIASLLMERNAEFSSNVDGSTPLHFAVGTGDLELVKSVLAKWPMSGQMDKKGWTPELIAANLQETEILKALLGDDQGPILSRTSGSASAASAAVLLHIGSEDDRLLAKQHLLLARSQLSDEAESARKRAQSFVKWGEAGKIFGAALLGALEQQQQRSSQRQLNQVLALNAAVESGGGYGSYQSALRKFERASVNPNQLQYGILNAGAARDYDVGMLLVNAATANSQKLEVEALLRAHGWDPAEVSILEPTKPGKFKHGPGLYGAKTKCERLLPGALRSVVGTAAGYSDSLIAVEDEYEEMLVPVHFLWEMEGSWEPVDYRDGVCRHAVFVEQCQVAMDWQEDIISFGRKCL